MPWHTQYRPHTFEDVIGQAAVVASLRDTIERDASRAFLFTGPAGTGKTTLARLTARALDVDDRAVQEIDGATHGRVEDMRGVLAQVDFLSLDGTGRRAFIVDECHQLSKATWQSLLKAVEEPPDHVVWLFCTTEPHKVPSTIRTRCHAYALKPCSREAIRPLLTRILQEEDVRPLEGIVDLVLDSCNGSPREAIVRLSTCAHASSLADARVLMQRVQGSAEAIDVARLIFSDFFTLVEVQKLLSQMKDQNPEGVRIVIVAYATSVFLSARDDATATFACRVLSTFDEPVTETNKIGGIALRLGRLLYLRK